VHLPFRVTISGKQIFVFVILLGVLFAQSVPAFAAGMTVAWSGCPHHPQPAPANPKPLRHQCCALGQVPDLMPTYASEYGGTAFPIVYHTPVKLAVELSLNFFSRAAVAIGALPILAPLRI
jgi:hypothetical protein